MSNIIDRLKEKYKTGTVITKLIFINVGVFVLLHAINTVLVLLGVNMLEATRFELITFLTVPSGLYPLMNRFWTPLTYMFVHERFWHILFNMLWLYWFGRMFLQYFNGRTLGSLYLLGGLAGAALYVFAFNVIPAFVEMRSFLLGASGAVMAIVMGAAFYRPDVKLNFFFVQIRVIYIAIALLIIDFLSIGNPANPGGHIAHLGGAGLGYLFAVQYRKGKDITAWMSMIMDWVVNLFKPRPKKAKMKVNYTRPETDWEYNKRKNDEQAEIDAILDKLKQSGYSGLSAEEKRKLFDASRK